MQIAVSHTSLDFDALASQLGVTKLHPQARMAVCSPLLGNMRDYLTMHRSQLPLVQMKYLGDEPVSKIFIVDCQHLDRLDPVVQELIARGTPYSIFDHHENDSQGLAGKAQTDSIIEPIGACTTLLVEKIEKGKIKLNPFEATLLALGIYEDTGCLTYNNTTNRDATALAFLLRQGADLQVINEYMRPKFTDAQQALLQDMVTGARLVNLCGKRVVFAAAVTSDYIDGLATLTRKLIEIESADAAFAAVQMRDRIYLVGRSDTPAIDVRQVVRLYGGDGHMGAGSAVIKNIVGAPIDTDGSCAPDNTTLSEEPVGAKFMSPGLEQPAKTRAQQASPLHSDEHCRSVAGTAGVPTKILADIEKFLTENVEPELTAEKIMSMPAKMILPSVSMDEAGKIMIRYNLDGLLVAEEGKVVGVIGKRDVDQALHHKLGHAPVSGFMSRPVITISPDTAFSDIQSIMVRNNIGRLPVMSKTGELLGVVSRSDVLRILFNKTPDGEHGLINFAPTVSSDNIASNGLSKPRPYNTHDIEPSIPVIKPDRDYTQILAIHERLSALDPDIIWLFREIGNIAGQSNMSAYAVGGLVRDMILGLDQLDLDFVIEGSAITIAEKLTANHPDKFKLLNKHERFQTATVSYLSNPERTIDLSTARQEFYEHPAALPTVEPSLLKEDIFRRDFTINTLALALNPDQFGILIDYFHGLEDLQAGIVRILHQFSFVEDPTRILRAARFASRFGFKLDDNTAELARHAIAMGIFDNLAGARMKEELRLILASPIRLTALEILSALGAKLRYLDEELAYGNTEKKLLRRGEQVLKQYAVTEDRSGKIGTVAVPDRSDVLRRSRRGEIYEPATTKEQSWLVFLALLLSRLPLERLVRILGRLHLVNEDREMIIRGLSLDQEITQLKKNAKHSEIYRVFHNAADVSLAIAACLARPGSPGRRVIKLYLEELNGVHTELSGRDLLQMGFSEGPEIGKALEVLLNAKLDGIVRNRQEEEEFIKNM